MNAIAACIGRFWKVRGSRRRFSRRTVSPVSWRWSGQSEVGVHGVLRIHGQDHDVTLPAKISVENGRFTATSHLSIPYVKWGMKDPSTFLLRVNETVEVEMRVAGTIRQQSW